MGFLFGGSKIRGIKRGEAPLRNFLPSPLHKGREIKGEGLIIIMSLFITFEGG